jgi:hypothetical protein
MMTSNKHVELAALLMRDGRQSAKRSATQLSFIRLLSARALVEQQSKHQRQQFSG